MLKIRLTRIGKKKTLFIALWFVIRRHPAMESLLKESGSIMFYTIHL